MIIVGGGDSELELVHDAHKRGHRGRTRTGV
jgi:hypothetical protein